MNGTATRSERRAESRRGVGAERGGDWLETSRRVFREFHREEGKVEKARRATLAELGVRQVGSRASSASLALRRVEGSRKIRRSFRLAAIRAGFGAGLALSIAGLLAAVLHVQSSAPASGAPAAEAKAGSSSSVVVSAPIERVDRGSAEEFDRAMQRRGFVRDGDRWMSAAQEGRLAARDAAGGRAHASASRPGPAGSVATVASETEVAASGSLAAPVEPTVFRSLGQEFILRAALAPREGGEVVVARGAADLPDGTVVTARLISGSETLVTRDAVFAGGAYDCELAPLPGRLFPAVYTVRVEIDAAEQPAAVRAILGGGTERAAKEVELSVRLEERETLLGLAYEEIESAAGALLALGMEARRLREAAPDPDTARQLASVALRMAGAVAGPEIDRRYAAAPFGGARELLRSLEGAGEIDPSVDAYDSLERELDRVLAALRAEVDLLVPNAPSPLAMADEGGPRAR